MDNAKPAIDAKHARTTLKVDVLFPLFGFFLFLVFVTLRLIVVAPFSAPGSSMQPAIDQGDRFWVDQRAYGFGIARLGVRLGARTPKRGDIIVFIAPSSGHRLVKRVVGVPGDRVQMIGGRLHLNGQAVPTFEAGINDQPDGYFRILVETLPGGVTYDVHDTEPDAVFDDTDAVTVPPEAVFVLGDNRDNSLDSRDPEFGPIPQQRIIGRMIED